MSAVEKKWKIHAGSTLINKKKVGGRPLLVAKKKTRKETIRKAHRISERNQTGQPQGDIKRG